MFPPSGVLQRRQRIRHQWDLSWHYRLNLYQTETPQLANDSGTTLEDKMLKTKNVYSATLEGLKVVFYLGADELLQCYKKDMTGISRFFFDKFSDDKITNAYLKCIEMGGFFHMVETLSCFVLFFAVLKEKTQSAAQNQKARVVPCSTSKPILTHIPPHTFSNI